MGTAFTAAPVPATEPANIISLIDKSLLEITSTVAAFVISVFVICAITLFERVFELITGETETVPEPDALNIIVFNEKSLAEFTFILPFIFESDISAFVLPA